MGADANAVVDERLRVRGIGHLRVIDASIMPTVVSGNTNAAVVMIAEKGADMILQDAAAAKPAAGRSCHCTLMSASRYLDATCRSRRWWSAASAPAVCCSGGGISLAQSEQALAHPRVSQSGTGGGVEPAIASCGVPFGSLAVPGGDVDPGAPPRPRTEYRAQRRAFLGRSRHNP